ncbi:MAG: HEAT repeat domain-containing protein, partial [Blastocatellia bacterium]
DEEQRIDAITRIGALWSAAPDPVELPVVTALGNSLQQDSSPVVRALAARALEIIGGNQSSGQSAGRAVQALIAALGTEREVAVRKAIIYALARYPQPPVTTALVPLLKDKKAELRAAAAYALAENGDSTSAQALTEVLRRGGKDEDAFARSQAARALGRIGGHDSIDPLIEALIRDRSQEVRREAARALGRIATRQDAKVIEALRGATLSNDPYLVIAADSAISSINSRNP